MSNIVAELAGAGPKDGAARTALVLLAAPQSGASALAEAFSHLGFASPAAPASPQISPPRARFEPAACAQLGRAMLDWAGAKEDRPGPFLTATKSLRDSANLVAALVERRFMQEGLAALRADFGERGDFVFKEPGAIAFLPFWDRTLRAFGAEPRYILVHRNPLETFAALRERRALAFRPALQLLQICSDAMLAFASRQPPAAVVSFAELLTSPGPILRRVLADLGRPTPSPAAFEAAEASVRPQDRHHRSGPLALKTHAHMPPLVRDTHDLLESWEATGAGSRQERMAGLAHRFEDLVMLGGVLTPVTPAKLEFPAPLARGELERIEAEAAASPLPAPSPRPAAPPLLVLHYHLFKNAGTSVDEMLKRNFGSSWSHAEFAPPPPGRNTNVETVAAYLRARPELLAFSSHTSLLPLPDIGREIFPIVFIRHPIDRLKSAYSFERKQIADTHGARLAKDHDFAGYLRVLLADPRQRQARNFQAMRLACNEPRDRGSELERALRTLEALPFVGLVEEYDFSLERLQALLEPKAPGFKSVVVHTNRTHETKEPLEAKLRAIRASIGADLYEDLVSANAQDIQIFEWVSARMAPRSASAASA